MRLNSIGNKKLTIVNAYRVSQETKINGESTSYMQQYIEMRRRGIENPKPKSKVLEDLEEFRMQEKKEGNRVMLMANMNEDSREKKKLYEFMNRTGLYDVHKYLYLHDEPPSTYTRGKKQIDICMVTEDILEACEDDGWLEFLDGVFF